MPEPLIFVRRVNCVSLLYIAQCKARVQQFKPSLKAPYRVAIDGDYFTIRFGGSGQIVLWVNGTFQQTEDGFTRIQADVGVENTLDNLKLVGGLLLLVLMMTLAEVFDNDLVEGHALGAIAFFIGLFLVVLVGGMALSQHLLRKDVVKLFCP